MVKGFVLDAGRNDNRPISWENEILKTSVLKDFTVSKLEKLEVFVANKK